jgi:glycosyltransferase involved in cell wall biosynthesis
VGQHVTSGKLLSCIASPANSPIRIAFDVSQAGPRKAGCGFYAAALVESLLAAGTDHRFTLLGSFGDFVHLPLMALLPPRRGCRWGPRHLLRRQAQRFWNDRQAVARLLNGVDVVQANNFWCPPWPVRPALVYTVYDLSFAEHPEWHRERNRLGCFQGMQRAAVQADGFVAISEASRRAFLRHFPHVKAGRVQVIYPASRFDQPGLDLKPRRPRAAPWLEHTPFLLSTGTIEPRKNQLFLLEVYARFRARGGAAIPLVLAGGQGWLMEAFQQHLASFPWASDVHWLGYVSDAELAWLYGHCLINLYPSHYEGFGLPVLEGMGFGAPVICSDRTSMPEIVGEAGVLLPPDALEAWVRALEDLVGEPQRRSLLAEAGRRRARRFAWQDSAKALLALYGEAVARAASRGC